MPLVGEFHGKFWRARANLPPPPGVAGPKPMYPEWQSVIQRSVVLSISVFGPPLDLLHAWWIGLKWWWALIRAVSRLDAEQRATLFLVTDLLVSTSVEQRAVIGVVLERLTGPLWPDAQAVVRRVATTPKFHQPEQWVEYGRALRHNVGQAQNVYRHLKAVLDLQARRPISNPDAHLLTELAYQGLAAMGRPGRKLVTH